MIDRQVRDVSVERKGHVGKGVTSSPISWYVVRLHDEC